MIKSRRMRVRARRTHGEKLKAYRILVGYPEGKILLGRPRLDEGWSIILN
jgi:hypothetical protein